MIRRPPRSTLDRSSAASDVYKRQDENIIVEKVRQQEINSTVEALSTRDSPLIRKKFEVVVLHSTIIN